MSEKKDKKSDKINQDAVAADAAAASNAVPQPSTLGTNGTNGRRMISRRISRYVPIASRYSCPRPTRAPQRKARSGTRNAD